LRKALIAVCAGRQQSLPACCHHGRWMLDRRFLADCGTNFRPAYRSWLATTWQLAWWHS